MTRTTSTNSLRGSAQAGLHILRRCVLRQKTHGFLERRTDVEPQLSRPLRAILAPCSGEAGECIPVYGHAKITAPAHAPTRDLSRVPVVLTNDRIRGEHPHPKEHGEEVRERFVVLV